MKASPNNRVRGALLPLMLAPLAAAAFAGELRLVEHSSAPVTIHLGQGSDNPGDLMQFENPVFDAANKIQVATDHGFCIRVTPGKSWECLWTLTTKDGQITVEGPYMDTGDSHFAVTGGTGKYAGARGSMMLHPRDTQSRNYDFVYELL